MAKAISLGNNLCNSPLNRYKWGKSALDKPREEDFSVPNMR